MLKVINKGYTIKLNSSENDGDYKETVEKTFDNLNDIKFILDCIKLAKEYFGYCNSYRDVDNLELDENGETLIRNLFKFYNKELDEFILDCFLETCMEFLGYSYEGYVLREIDSYNVFYSPEDIYLEKVEL